jgi:hypothetical protein
MFPDQYWYAIKDADPRGRYLYERHYSCLSLTTRRKRKNRRNRNHFVGPGEKLVLLTADSLALFVWRKFIDQSGQQGVNCAIFRNESQLLSSQLILEAEQIAWQKWPGSRLYTYVNPRAIRSTNPGYCFKIAGWNPCGHTKKRNLLILEKLPL